MSTCDHCRSPLSGAGHAGRPWPGRAAATYCCYGCLSLGERSRQEAATPATGWALGSLGIRLGIGVLVVGQSMIFGLALNLHDDVPADVRWAAETLILCCTLLVAALLGGPLVRTVVGELRRGRLTIECLFLLTMTGAMAASLQAHLTGRGKIYFEVISVLLVVYTLGKVIGARSRAAAIAGSRSWAGLLESCRLVGGSGATQIVAVTMVRPGDLIEVYPGETIAVDGIVRGGVGFVSEAVVTGEPFPVVRRPGDAVVAGSASHDATFQIEATSPGTERQIDRLIAAVDEARNRPASLQGRADEIGRAFFPLVVLTAIGTFGHWSFLTAAGWEAGLFHAMSVLLVACPCVIGLATPIVIWSAVGRLAERGVIVRAGDAVERLAEIDRVVFDKTGTLTDDSFTLVDIVTATEGESRATLLGWVSLVESQCPHPVARPFALLPQPFPPAEVPRVTDLRTVPGCGVTAWIEQVDGTRHHLQIGRPEWVAESLTPAGNNEAPSGGRTLPVLADDLLTQTGHRVDVALDGELAAVAIVAERLRGSVQEMLADFARLGLPVEVLTGDTPIRAAALPPPPTPAGLLPADKQAHIGALMAAGGAPLMVGDGINDAAALAAAHVGVALASGTDLAVGASAITLYHGDLRALPWAVALCREAVRAVRRSLARALTYNLVGMTLAACGVLHPVVAALLMVVSSLSLIFTATRVGARTSHCGQWPVVSGQPLHRVSLFSRLFSKVKTDSWPLMTAPLHTLALVAQGGAFLLLLEPARVLSVGVAILSGFGLAGLFLGRAWARWLTIPHSVDMAVGMLTLGNLGMLLGWWADNGFSPLRDGGCQACVDMVRVGTGAPWMWFGMLVGGNIAMLVLGRRPLPWGTDHVPAMFSGGNLGMVAGMVIGGSVAHHVPTASVAAAVVVGFAGMTVGMIAGMLVGTWLTEWLIAAGRAMARLPRWLRAPEPAHSAGLLEEIVRRQAKANHNDSVTNVGGG